MTSVCRFRFINSVAVKEKKKTPKNKQINASLKGCLYSLSSVSRSCVNICSTGPTQDMQKSELQMNTLSAAHLCTHTMKLGRCNFGFKALQQKDSISACLCRGFLGWWWCGWCFFFLIITFLAIEVAHQSTYNALLLFSEVLTNDVLVFIKLHLKTGKWKQKEQEAGSCGGSANLFSNTHS